jgi:hypothetical protein
MKIKSAVPRAAAVARIHREWPEADEIRFEGMCPDCKRPDTLWSFQRPLLDTTRGDDEETCAYWCSRCAFSQAGSRPSLDVEKETSNE